MKKLIGVGVILLFMLELSGCGSLSFLQSGSSTQSSRPVESAQGSAAASSENAENSSSSVQSQSDSSDPSVSSAVTALQTQQEVLQQTKAVLSTKVPLKLPESVPVAKGECLTSAAVSQSWYYKASFYGTEQPAAVNSKDASKGKLIAAVEGTEYKNANSAKENINGYTQVDLSVANKDALVDLGHNIKAVEDAGCGHGYLSWNEGRWCVNVDSPNDPTYQNKTYPDSKKLAKNIVAYLDDHMLPVPEKIGLIAVNNWNNNMGAIISWQDNQMVYQVTSQDPMTALQVAVAMKSE